jgi:hypothetical protein
MTTSRSLERRGAFMLACITALLAIVLAVWFVAAVSAEPLPVPKPPGQGGHARPICAPDLPPGTEGRRVLGQ